VELRDSCRVFSSSGITSGESGEKPPGHLPFLPRTAPLWVASSPGLSCCGLACLRRDMLIRLRDSLLPSADSSTSCEWDPSGRAGSVKYAVGGCCWWPRADCACQCNYDGGGIMLLRLELPFDGWLAAVQTAHIRYWNEGWRLITISSLPVRCAAAFTHNSEQRRPELRRVSRACWMSLGLNSVVDVLLESVI